MGSDKFCLKWNDFDTNFSGSLRDLRGERELEDVSLVSDTGDVRAHKLVLAASSPLFRAIITRNPHSHPLLYLKGVTATNLNYVLDFIYNGEVNVAQDDLNSFLTAAEDLKIKGLTQQQQSQDNSEATAKKVKSQSNPETPKQSRKCKDGDDIVEIIPSPIKHEVGEANYSDNENFGSTAVAVQDDESYHEASGYDEEQQMVYHPGDISFHNEGVGQSVEDMLVEAVDAQGCSVWRCLACGKDFPSRGNGKRHVETLHLEAPQFTCHLCDRVLKNKNSYQNHLNLMHGIKKRSRINQ